MSRCRSSGAVLAVTLPLGCMQSPAAADPGVPGPPPGPDTGSGEAPTATGSATAGTPTGSTRTLSTGTQGATTGASTDHADTSGPGLRFDVGYAGDLGAPETTGCTKVDLLFVVDNSGSMADHQDNLAASFPGFVSGMRAALADADSFHVGVVTTDAYAHNAPPCDDLLGALVTETGGANAGGSACGPFVSGLRFLTDEDDLEARFACVAAVGTSGSGHERPAEAAIEALSPALGVPGACNEGFLRDDALLVVVIITDEDDRTSAGDPPDWHAAIVGAKGGADEHVVVLALLGHDPPNQCVGQEVHGADRLIDLTDRFAHGSIGDVCAPSYAGYFERAVEVIDLACEGFTPG